MPTKKTFIYYEVLVALLITTLIVSNIASVKLVQLGNLVFDAGTILFPLAYIIGDIITEIYGFRRMRRLLYIGLAMLALTTVVFAIVQVLPSPADWQNQAAYTVILGVVWRIVFASMVAFFVGELLNSYILAKLKIKTKGKKLWNRLVSSSAIGSLIDTIIFSVLAFGGTISGQTMVQLIATVYAIKIVTEIALSPLTMKIITYLKKKERLDTFEEPKLGLYN
ncbi:MAG TPA: queuosine precursor transporter [Candidatus Saccharibacteria bacterium]|nr:queuosine precursor transporter [Candidatus Saccharibacteria bacterium]MCB9817110.1 queuosine precursor transporter [Candidatus Nomurabacteria bacterium]HPR10208.1 queuosine precursor transporter [Candidatus Saccharibacteria bacterium]